MRATIRQAMAVGLLFACGPQLLVAQGHRVRTVVDSMEGGVGGVAVDRIGTIYVADFRETVWKVSPDGRAERFATGFYGASGNAVDARGYLYQSNFYGNYISKVDRFGNHVVYADSGVSGPVGITLDSTGNLYVTNCSANSLSKVTPAGAVSTFSQSTLFNCPNGITRAGDGTIYVVNYGDEKMLRVSPEGSVSEFAALPGGGNGHVAFVRGALYATSFQGHRIYRVTLDGQVTLLAGTGGRGEQDGAADQATFSWPNGIAAGPQGDRVYVNDFINRFPPTIEVPPIARWSLRQITFETLSTVMVAALQRGGIEAMVAAHQGWKSNSATSGLYTEVQLNQLGYQLMSQNQLAAATRVFELNTEDYPDSFNVWDSLGEAYMNAGRTDEAITMYEKSLELNPGNTNAVQMLEKLRGG
jgi:sugar lactone lactonase YvrE